MRKAAVEAEALAAAASAAALAAAASAAALAAQHAAADARRRLFISALIATAQNGFGLDLDHALHLCRETWGEEDLFNAVIDLPHGAVKLKKPDGTPLWELDEDGDEVKDDEGERVQAIDPYGKKRTRLMYAAQEGDVVRLRWLFKRGARLELEDWEGHTALWWACSAGRVGTMRELLSRGAAVNPAEGVAPLHAASAGGHLYVVRELLARGAKLELKDKKGHTALWWAGDAGRCRGREHLLGSGCGEEGLAGRHDFAHRQREGPLGGCAGAACAGRRGGRGAERRLDSSAHRQLGGPLGGCAEAACAGRRGGRCAE